MADIVVPIVLENLIKLGTYEANLLLGVRDQVDTLESDLRFIKVFLKKSAGTRNDPFVEELVNQIRDAALGIEDVIDTYAARVIKERRRNLLGKLFHCFGHAMVLHGVANKTTRIMNKVENIYNNKEKYGIGEADQPSVDDEEPEQSSIERRRRNVEEDDVVGFEKDTATLIDQLINQINLQRDVITIHGMGGLGKSTLARKIYKDTRVVNHFACRAWVVVSQQWQAKTLLLDVLKSFKQISDETATAEELKTDLKDQLKGKRYLIVMDDIWSTQVWDEVRVAFPDESNGSRILITTRVRDVARHASPTPPHDLKLLDESDSWELLRKEVFRGRECPPDLTELGKKIAKSCGGLPLSIVLVGGTLAAEKKSHQVWLRFVANVNLYLKQGISFLTLSYDHLPPELKACFLYLGLFPEDSEINVRDLIELWIGEGLIQSDRSTSIYDVAEDYLEKLIDRSMIQVATNRLDGGVKTCRMHDLLRDLCIAESRRDKFFDTYSIDNSVSHNRNSRRLSIRHISAEFLNFDLSSSCARSLLFFGAGVDYSPICMSVWKHIYKFIRVLRLFGLEFKKIPSQIDELIFLRCLFIKRCRVDHVSSSIWKFRYLETLHLELESNRLLPKGIWSVMKHLRYLYMPGFAYYGSFHFSKPPLGEPFRNLQVLSWVDVNHNTALVIAKFPNLRKLGLHFYDAIEESEVENVMASIRKLESLQKFKIGCPTRHCSKVGSSLNLLPSALTKFSLTTSDTFNWDMLKFLARKPHLRVLKIHVRNAIGLHKLSVAAGDFPQLQALKLRGLNIQTLGMEKDAMPNLESLIFRGCEYLEYLQEDELLCRTNLKLVEVCGRRVPAKLKTVLTNFKNKSPAPPCKINITERQYP
ncbi:hypothetical protein FNV43_RR20336 [Rhamnella rubrinervis]|uniref:Uncharacterized protein n=1 Tax=Rhamnella rubrinervis TaxID=2594499 RepID=A0A8K0E192_9ROSA|nr:hypothetical protein FNV43_RR20336 [Rhamnella rubrinervis]